MRRITLSLISLLVTASVISLYAATGTPSSLVVRTDANSSLVVTAVTQVNPVTSGVFSSRVLRTDSSGNLQVILSGTVTPTYPMAIPASTCAAPSLGLSGNTDNGIAFTATPSILNCIEGVAVTTLTGSSLTSTVRSLWPNGTDSAPSYSSSSYTSTGMYFPFSNTIGLSSNGNLNVAVGSDITVRSTSAFNWASGAPGASVIDLSLFRETAGSLFQRVSTAAQRFSVAHTYTSSTNYEAFSIDWQTQANVASVGTRTATTGTARDLRLLAQVTNGGGEYSIVNLSRTAPFIRLIPNASLGLTADNIASAVNWIAIAQSISTSTSGTVVPVAILPTYNQASGTAANTDLLINRTETAVGSGVQNLIDMQVAGASQFAVRNDGTVVADGNAGVSGTCASVTVVNGIVTVCTP